MEVLQPEQRGIESDVRSYLLCYRFKRSVNLSELLHESWGFPQYTIKRWMSHEMFHFSCSSPMECSLMAESWKKVAPKYRDHMMLNMCWQGILTTKVLISSYTILGFTSTHRDPSKLQPSKSASKTGKVTNLPLKPYPSTTLRSLSNPNHSIS